MATDYHVVTLPNKTKVPVRDHFLRDGRKFSVDGDVLATAVKFDGSGDVKLNAKLADGVVQVTNINSNSVANNISQSSTTDNRLVSAGAVVQELEKIRPLPWEKIDELFDW